MPNIMFMQSVVFVGNGNFAFTKVSREVIRGDTVGLLAFRSMIYDKSKAVTERWHVAVFNLLFIGLFFFVG